MLDIDECSQGLCSGKCVNTVGSYHCSCPVGFFYDAEKRICAGMLSIVGLLHNIKGAVRSICEPPNGHRHCSKDSSYA